MTQRKLTQALAATALIALTGCAAAIHPAGNLTPSRQYSEEQIIDHLHLVTYDGGISYDYATRDGLHCDADPILTSKQTINFYRSAGDTVVANPAGTVGIKVDPADLLCYTALRKALADLPPQPEG